MYSLLQQTKQMLFRTVTAQLPGEDGYSGGKIVFIDTENTLYPPTGNKHATFDGEV